MPKTKFKNFTYDRSNLTVTIDVSALNFNSSDDYLVILPFDFSGNNTAVFKLVSKSATSFVIERNSVGTGLSGTAIVQIMYNA